MHLCIYAVYRSIFSFEHKNTPGQGMLQLDAPVQA